MSHRIKWTIWSSSCDAHDPFRREKSFYQWPSWEGSKKPNALFCQFSIFSYSRACDEIFSRLTSSNQKFPLAVQLHMFKHFLFGCSTSSIQKFPLAIQLFMSANLFLICLLAVHSSSTVSFFIVIIIIIVKILRNFGEYNPLLGSMTGHFLHLISLVHRGRKQTWLTQAFSPQ